MLVATTSVFHPSATPIRRTRPSRRHLVVVALCIAVAAVLGIGIRTWHRQEARHAFRLHGDVGPTAESLALALYQSTGASLRPGHEVRFVDNGAVFDAIAQEIRAATSTVHVDVYIWQKGRASDTLLAALSDRKAGVACRVVVDDLGSTHFEKEVQPALLARGCEVHVLRPLLEGDGKVARNHRKLVVVDGRVAFTGGFGIRDEWLGDGVTAEGWRDTNVRFVGSAVTEAQQAFAENWQEAGGALLPADVFPSFAPRAAPAAPPDGAFAALVTSAGAPTVTRAERLVQLVIRSAQKRLWVANAYFVPPDGLLDAMKEKARAGVDVRLLVPGKKNDSKISEGSQVMAYDDLTAAGIRPFEYLPSMMHAKTIVADDAVAVIGSINLEPLSLTKLDEDALVVHDPAVNAELARRFEADCTHARAVH